MTEKDLDIIIGKKRLKFRSPIWWITAGLISLSLTAGFYISVIAIFSVIS